MDIHMGGTPPITPAPVKKLYTTQFTRQGDWIPNDKVSSVNDLMQPVFPGLPHGYEYERPNIVVDGGKWQFNMSGRDFTGDNSGSDKREFDIDVQTFVRPGQTGEFKIWPGNSGGDNRVVGWPKDHAQVCKLNSTKQQESFFNSFRLKLTDAPRGGEKDWFKIWIEPSIKSASKNNGFYLAGVIVDFILPFTEQNSYRQCHVYSILNGKLSTVNLDSINRVEEQGQYLHFRNDKGEDVLMQKAKDTVGFWFQAAKGEANHYQILFEGGETLTVHANSFELIDDRFYVEREGHIEGWVNSDFVKSVKIVR